MNLLREIFGSTENEPEDSEENNVEETETCCNHGHGEPDSTFYHEKKNIIEGTWTFKARDKYECDNCGAEVSATRELGTVEIDDGENLVIQNA